MNRAKLYVITGIDTEEEGLFSGKYESRNPPVANLAFLPELAPLGKDFGLPLTLFCTHAVFANTRAAATVAWMREHCEAEIGAHLHHWSTPPFENGGNGDCMPQRTHTLSPELLEERLRVLLDAGAIINGGALTSFRMGRWDLKSRLFPLLARNGIKVDSSICPLRAFADGPDHFLAPSEPYRVVMADNNFLLEVPITQIPLSVALAKVWLSVTQRSRRVRDSFHFFGALSANPLWHGDAIMRLGTRLHVARGGKVLNIFWHSSEMMPGGSPHIPDQAAARRLLQRIFSFCEWLKKNFDVQGVTASGFAAIAEKMQLPLLPLCNGRDW